jgi:CRISPR-associated protein Csa3
VATYIFTLGYHEDYIIRRLHMNKADASDKIYVVTVKPLTGTSLKAFDNLEAYCMRLGLQKPVLVEIDVRSEGREFLDLLDELIDVVLYAEEPLVIDVSGGMRILGLTLYTAALVTGKRAVLYISPENEPIEYRIDLEEIKTLATELTEEKKQVIEAVLRNPGTTIPEIAKELNKSEKTITNHINTLKKQRLVAAKGKRNNLYLTKLGKIKTKIMKYSTEKKPIEETKIQQQKTKNQQKEIH